MFYINYNGVNLLSNTTVWWRDIYILYYLLHREQLNVSALDNGHLQVYMKHLKSSYTNIYIYSLLIWGRGWGVKWARDLVFGRTVGTCGVHGGFMVLPS